jgi:S1-C subfamily serine protease
MDSGHTGVVVQDVDPALGKDSIRTDDIILEIDGYKVSNNGRIRLAGGEPRSLDYSIYTKQLGEKVPVKVYRDGTVVETEIPVAKKDLRFK